ncbi:MAG: type III glutamate--ammonia ligase, partial [Dongiaceae bacterium]
ASKIEALKKSLKAQGVKYFFGAYVDGLGVPKSKCVPIDHLAAALAGSELYTVGALEAMGPLGPNEDECVALPDLASVTVLPWDKRYAIAAADLAFHDKPYSHCSRTVLKRQLAAAAELGFAVNMGVEPELYVLRDVNGELRPFVEEDMRNKPTRGYDLETTMLADKFLEPMVDHINALGWDVYSFDHEGGDGQYEFDFNYTDALAMCDRMMIFRLMAKHVARSIGCVASFMPKPWSNAFGSGAHFNLSLADRKSGRNMFEAADVPKSRDGRGYSELAYHFTAGVLHHADAITAVVCPTINSYKRLNPRGFMNEMSWAPVFRAHGANNRTLMCRLPMNRRCLELRNADSAVNFYLGAAIAIAAGLDGIRRKLDPGPSVDYSTYDVSEEELEARGIHRLPRTLGQAIEVFAKDEMAKAAFGPAFHDSYAKYKQAEWQEYCLVVGDWERERYMHIW